MPKKLPLEFKRDVVRVARRGDLTVNEVSRDFATELLDQTLDLGWGASRRGLGRRDDRFVMASPASHRFSQR